MPHNLEVMLLNETCRTVTIDVSKDILGVLNVGVGVLNDGISFEYSYVCVPNEALKACLK